LNFCVWLRARRSFHRPSPVLRNQFQDVSFILHPATTDESQ
jgi:hypothetical protein